MNIGEKLVLLQEVLKFEDDRQEVLYQEFHRLCDPWPSDLEKNLTSEEKQELLMLNEERRRKESEAMARPPEFLTWNSAEETERNLHTLLQTLQNTNNIVERIIAIIKKLRGKDPTFPEPGNR